MAVLDQADPRPLARQLGLETGYDQDGKFMAGRELVSRDVTDPKTGEAQIESIILSVSTVASHPGKTLAGCTYSLDLPEEEAGRGPPQPRPPAVTDRPSHPARLGPTPGLPGAFFPEMSEDDSSSSAQEPSEKKRGWLERLTSAFSGEPHTRDELVAVLHTAQEEGLIAADTLKMMEGAISVAELTVGDVMISRSQMVSLPVEAPFLELMKQVVESGHSRFPVHGENKDDILGILLAKDLLRGVVADNGPANVRELLRPAVLIPEAKKLNVLLKEFRLSRNHMAIVVDEYGGVAGLVTIEDVLEQIVGEIDDEHDEAEDPSAQIAIQSDGQYVVDALTPIGDFNERFGATFSDEDYDTIGGLVTEAVGHLPEVGDELALDRFMFRVARADARRVQAFHVTVLPPDAQDDA
jgi:magnesium and cobalt transporter